jgi:signal transduction histidine kinase
MVKNVIGRFKEQFEEANCRMEMIIKDGIFTLCDQLRMEQVMTNLITNAMKYGAGSLIQFHLDLIDDNQTIFLSVKDGGIGIPKDKQEKIFERFERLTSYKHVGGLGLGLFIVKKIVSSHQGEVYVESEPGKGATFIVKLPLLKTS